MAKINSPSKAANIIGIYGARQHNLKNIDVEIPRDQLVVITGPSGSGKSSLAFDTLYAEGQRRYVESLSAYARQFLDRMQKPDVDHITGLSPAISIEQRSAGGNPRSIVATSTEIFDYLRLLYAHVGRPHCPHCGQPIKGQSPQRICDLIMNYPEGKRLMLLAPYVRGRKGQHREALEKMKRDGFSRVRVDGEVRELEEDITLGKNIRHSLDAVVDRLVTGKLDSSRLADSVERALRHGEGMLIVLVEEESGWQEQVMSEHLACHACNLSFGELLPRNFSFNSPYGACPACHGLGSREVVDESLAVDAALSLDKGAIPLWRSGPRRLVIYHDHLLRCVAGHYGFSLSTPFRDLPEQIRNVLLNGSGDEELTFSFRWGGRQLRQVKPFEGILPNLTRRLQETESQYFKDRLRKVTVRRTCPACEGARLRPESLAVTVHDQSIHQFVQMSVEAALDHVESLALTEEEGLIANEILREIKGRLGFLKSVGLGYLTLNRESGSLSGGEAQRIRLATQVGSGLVGVLYVLDEPSIGLHQRDNHRLLATLAHLRDLGNTVVVVEHDLDTILAADYIVDLGPRAGAHGGEVVCAGTVADVRNCAASLTGQYLNGTKQVEIPETRQAGNGKFLKVIGARENNLKSIDVAIPLGTFCCVTGVSGSGKSTLVNTILTRALNLHFGIGKERPGAHDRVEGLEAVNKMIVIDQSPIGRTPRSNPATYTGLFDDIRQLFARLPESRVRGYKPGRFSFNVKGGRCEDCHGDGIKKIEMQFLPDVYVTCESCKGKRYTAETLLVEYKGRSIAEILDMTVNEACRFFSAIPKLFRKLQTLADVGLGYIHLGQPATTLSGGEAQRVKLSTELAKMQRGHTLYVLDEPTTGLHIDDINKLLEVLLKLRDQGNTVLVIEHNMDVIKVSDHIVDLGPEGGRRGGEVVATGTPESLCEILQSYTGAYLRSALKPS